ncbi:GNAT family N-acetyltransferase [Candidatus Acetothermia bacterium]|nr:GNAT family N-acetyltransferase [Candidatus Acetothermia bacterium]
MKPGVSYLRTVEDVLSDEPRVLSVPLTIFIDKHGRPFRICRLGTRDFERLVEMYVSFEPKSQAGGLPPTDEPRIRAWLEKLIDQGLNLIAKDKSQIVAHAVLSSIDEREAEVAVFVHQGFQGLGLGHKLVTCLVTIANLKDFEKIWGLVESENSAIIHINHSLGFSTYRISQGSVEMELKLHERK